MGKKHKKNKIKITSTNIKELFMIESEKRNKKYGTSISEFAAFLTREIETLETKNRSLQTSQNLDDDWIIKIREFADQTTNPEYIIDNIDRQVVFENTLLSICGNLYREELIKPVFMELKEKERLFKRWASSRSFAVHKFSDDDIDFLVTLKWK